MEFFRHVSSALAESALQDTLRIEHLARLCASIDRVLEADGDRGEIYCLWGQFRVRREPIRGGVRFSLPGCPNALAWTVTADASTSGGEGLTLHCTINRSTHDADIVESIELFVDDWAAGLLALEPSLSRGIEEQVDAV